MKKLTLMLSVLLLLTAILCGCSEEETVLPDGAVVIEGVYISDTLPVGYYFTKDGFGIQYIAGEPYRIFYYIIGDKIHIENFSVDDGNSADFDFEQFDDYITIGGIKYLLKEEENNIDNSD